MAKKRQELETDGAFFDDQPQKQQKPKKKPGPKTTDPVRSKGIGLRESEWVYLQIVADELGITVHELSLYALRYWIDRFKSGDRPQTKTKTVTVLELPD